MDATAQNNTTSNDDEKGIEVNEYTIQSPQYNHTQTKLEETSEIRKTRSKRVSAAKKISLKNTNEDFLPSQDDNYRKTSKEMYRTPPPSGLLDYGRHMS